METSTTLPEWLDKLAMRDLLERYIQVVEGRTAIREFFAPPEIADPAPWTDAGELLKQPGSPHLCANPVIDVDGETATSELDFQVARRDEEGRAVTAVIGRYRDRLRRREDGRWVITNRTAVSVARPGEERSMRSGSGFLPACPKRAGPDSLGMRRRLPAAKSAPQRPTRATSSSCKASGRGSEQLSKARTIWCCGRCTFGATDAYISAALVLKGLQVAGAKPTHQSFISGLSKVTNWDGEGLLAAPVNFNHFGTAE